MNCIIYLNGGKLFMDDSLLSLSFIVKSHKNIIPAIVCNESTELVLNKCEIKVNNKYY